MSSSFHFGGIFFVTKQIEASFLSYCHSTSSLGASAFLFFPLLLCKELQDTFGCDSALHKLAANWLMERNIAARTRPSESWWQWRYLEQTWGKHSQGATRGPGRVLIQPFRRSLRNDIDCTSIKRHISSIFPCFQSYFNRAKYCEPYI